jgi:hypothetical protein
VLYHVEPWEDLGQTYDNSLALARSLVRGIRVHTNVKYSATDRDVSTALRHARRIRAVAEATADLEVYINARLDHRNLEKEIRFQFLIGARTGVLANVPSAEYDSETVIDAFNTILGKPR